MTDLQKQNIEKMRLQGMGYKRIAGTLGIPVATVKSFCQRNNLASNFIPIATEASTDTNICKQCGKPLEQTSKGKTKIYCSDKCRYKYWNSNRGQRKSARLLFCAFCGEVFTVCGNRDRKYCGHPCYISSRFPKGGVRCDQGAI